MRRCPPPARLLYGDQVSRVWDNVLRDIPPTMRSSEGLIDDTSFVPADTEPLDGFTFLSVSFLDDPFLDYT